MLACHRCSRRSNRARPPQAGKGTPTGHQRVRGAGSLAPSPAASLLPACHLPTLTLPAFTLTHTQGRTAGLTCKSRIAVCLLCVASGDTLFHWSCTKGGKGTKAIGAPPPVPDPLSGDKIRSNPGSEYGKTCRIQCGPISSFLRSATGEFARKIYFFAFFWRIWTTHTNTRYQRHTRLAFMAPPPPPAPPLSSGQGSPPSAS